MSEHEHPAAPNASELERWIVAELAARLRLDPRALDRRERFNRFGLDSVRATAFTGELARHLGRSLPPTLMWDHPSVETLVRHLQAPAAGAVPVVPSPGRPNAPSIPRALEPIAVVGLSCRFPKAPDPAEYWRLLATGVDAITEVPRDRWNLDDVFDADVAAPGKMNTRWGGFLDQVDRFDAQAFGISPREAAQMDPQQRLVLELSAEALDDAGVGPTDCEARRRACSSAPCGATTRVWSPAIRPASRPHTATGQDTSIIAARVSYFYGVQGPSLTVNTACSSSLVAVHLACQSLRTGESSLALAGGVNLVLSPESTVAMSKFGAMAPDGRSKAFDAARERLRARRGWRHRRAEAAVEGARGRRPGLLRAARQRDEQRRVQQRADRPEPAGAGAGAARGLRERRRDPPNRSSTSRPTAPGRCWATRSKRARSAPFSARGAPPTGRS